MGSKLKRKRRVETGACGANKVSDLRQLQTRGIAVQEVPMRGTCAHPPIDGLIWTDHARQRFRERISATLEPELLYDFLKGRRPMLVPLHVETKLAANHERFAPYGLRVHDVCRVVLSWKPHTPGAPDEDTRGVWVVVTILPCDG